MQFSILFRSDQKYSNTHIISVNICDNVVDACCIKWTNSCWFFDDFTVFTIFNDILSLSMIVLKPHVNMILLYIAYVSRKIWIEVLMKISKLSINQNRFYVIEAGVMLVISIAHKSIWNSWAVWRKYNYNDNKLIVLILLSCNQFAKTVNIKWIWSNKKCNS